MEFAQVEAFIEAERRGSFRRAAKALFLSQPSLSNRIRLLETELGTRLFHRRGNGVVLTDTGHLFLPYATRALETLRDGRQVVATARDAIGGVVTIASSRVVGTYTLPGILDRLAATHPDIRASVTVSNSREVLQMVVEGQVQVGLSRGLVHPEVDTGRLFDEDLVLIARSDHPLTTSASVSIRDIAAEPLILYDTGASYLLMIEQACLDAGVAPRVEMRLDGVDAAKRMVENGMGISFVPRSVAAREVNAGSLAIVRLGPEHRMVLSTCVLVRRAKRQPDNVRALMGVLQDLYASPADPLSAPP